MVEHGMFMFNMSNNIHIVSVTDYTVTSVGCNFFFIYKWKYMQTKPQENLIMEENLIICSM